MFTLLLSAIFSIRSWFRSRAALQVEILALRHQLTVLKRSQRGRLRLNSADRLLWALPPLVAVALGAAYRKARNGDLLASKRVPLVLETEESAGRTGKARDRLGSSGVDRQDEFGKSGVGSTADSWETAQAQYRSIPGHRGQIHGSSGKPPSQTWRTFLNNHAKQLVSTDFFVVPTVTFRVLYVFVVLAHQRRRLLHFNVTSHPSSEWAAQQMVEALPWDSVPSYLLRDRDAIYGESFRVRVRAMGISEVLTAPQSPWQNPYAERLIGSIRRECLDHVIVFNESSLRRLLKSLFHILPALAHSSGARQRPSCIAPRSASCAWCRSRTS